MKKENEKKINAVDLENVSGGYKQRLSINTKDSYRPGYIRTTELSLGEALRLNYEGQMGQPDVEEKLRGYGFTRESTDIKNNNSMHFGNDSLLL